MLDKTSMTLGSKVNNKILVIAAHPDDEVLGAFSYLSDSRYNTRTVFVCEGSSGRFQGNYDIDELKIAIEQRENAAHLVAKTLGNNAPIFLNFKNFSLLPKSIPELNKKLEFIIRDFTPNMIITHSFNCNNSDHIAVSISVSNLVRSNVYPEISTVLHMEIPSSTEQSLGKNFTPNHFKELNLSQLENKLKCLSFYGEELQKNPAPRSEFGIKSYASFRGVASGMPYAEGFQIMRSIFRE